MLGPAFLVTIDEERDRGKWSDHPEERGPVAEQTPTDPGCDPVQAEQRHRAEHQDLREDERRQRLHVCRPRRPGDGCLGRGPEVRDLGGRKLGMAENPAGRRQHDLVATLEPDPAVVVDREREHQRCRDLGADQRPEHGARPLQQAVHRSPAPAGGCRRASACRHARPPSGTRRRCARSPRAAVYAPRSRRAGALGCRPRFAVVGRSASPCPT